MNNIQTLRHNILNISLFILGTIIISSLLCIFFAQVTDVYMYDILAVKVKCDDLLLEPDNSIQILFVGDSECFSCFDCNYLYDKYGYTSFNCGTGRQKICDSYAIAYEAFKNQTPQIIVLETNNLFRNISTDEDSNDPVLNFLIKNVPLFSNHSYWKPAIRKFMPKDRETKRRKNRGFVGKDIIVPYNGGKYMKKTKKVKKIKPDEMEYLDKINDLCNEKGCRLILVSTPSPVNWNYKKHNGVKKWAKEHSVDYLDLNLDKDIGINWKKDSKDGGDHLNKYGAKKVTTIFGKYIRDNYNILSIPTL